MRRLLLLVAGIGALAAVTAAQQPVSARFHSASIRPVKRAGGTHSQTGPGGRYTATNTSVEELVLEAYGIERFRLVGAPPWTLRERFDIDVTATGELTTSGTSPTLPPVLQSLLDTRFRLAAHIEDREFPVYVLSRVSEERLGPNLSLSTVDCSRIQDRSPDACRISSPGAVGRFVAASSRIASLVAALRLHVDRPVIDQTRLDGSFRIELTWAAPLVPSLAVLAAGPVSEPLPSRVGPSLFVAVQEQLGLKLEPAVVALKTVVIDSVQRPTAD